MRRTKNKTLALSIIIPVYNEEQRVKNLTRLGKFCKTKKYIQEYIVVNDGSTDATLKKLKEIQTKTKIRIVSYKHNRGKGYAIKRGIEKARGTHAVFLDVDLSTDLSAIETLIKATQKAPIIIGTRKNRRARLLERQSMVRESMGKIFTLLSQMISGVRVSDFTCGFKCFELSVAKKIAKAQRIFGWAYDVEYLYLGKKLGCRIIEIPVIWKNDKGTKVRFPQDILISLRDIIRIRLHNYSLFD